MNLLAVIIGLILILFCGFIQSFGTSIILRSILSDNWLLAILGGTLMPVILPILSIMFFVGVVLFIGGLLISEEEVKE